MPRRRRLRKIVAPPGFKGYKPYGHRPNNRSVELLYEEYEAIKLADYDLMNQLEASKLMGISRATFARIYETARRKIAEALVETKEIRAVYGHAHMDESWYVCNRCNARFNLPDCSTSDCCPMCQSKNIETIITNKEE
ncbi:DUF134 domain-containing protein [Carboxylicivirga linearis]|uniref:DUF134 domain-containing protein n=1 Tax=Carboxylicivirga linearis TaxID=1628157 RepID=A0ABS5JY43_9BACT|nr:DUF134 domain-containing protein [Carboxylicivirga linearis]MBS2099346.1 DUF134 domain-containing protein [Carboxylicivirga linearis]